MQVAKGVAAHLHIDVRDEDGVLAAATGNVAVVVKDVDGATVASGNATAGQHGHDVGEYSFTLPTAVTGELGEYTATATYTLSGVVHTRTFPIEVIGSFLFEIHELRDFDRAIQSTNDYPAESIREAREIVTRRLERAAQVAFSPRVKRVTLDGDGTRRLLLPDVMVTDVLSVTVYGEDIGADVADEVTGNELLDIEWDGDAGVLVRTDGSVFPEGSRNIVVDYQHGYEQVPATVRRAAMMVAVEVLVPSGLPQRATAQSTDLGDFRISVANLELGRPTGIPDVDVTIAEFGRRRPRFA